MAVQAQWNLDCTSDSVLSLARGVIQAATSDNVQPLAILACERFGNTIAISPETCRKIETSVLPTPSFVPIQFLKAVVGYSALDCATQLGKSQAGVQFLGLASSMVTTMGCYRSAMALHAMLRSSAVDRTLLPTTRQLRDLLESMEHRCQLSSFIENVLGWSMFLNGVFPEGHEGYVVHPSEKGIGDIVEAFRQLSRIGQSTVKTVTIAAHSTIVPWLVAFTKWCIGIPPIVLLEDGTSALAQPGANVVVVVLPSPKSQHSENEFEVRIQHTIPSLEQLLVSENPNHLLNGMVTIPCYGQWIIQENGFDTSFNSRVLDQALPHALRQVISLLQFCRDDRSGGEETEEVDEGSPHSSQYSEFSFIPFRDDRAITKTVSLFLNRPFTMETKHPDELLIEDLPLVKLHSENLKRSCACEECGRLRCLEGPSNFVLCEWNLFLERLAIIVARILTVSLFHFPESLRVLLLPPPLDGPFIRSIQDILRTGEPVLLEFNALLESALMLVGHDYKEIAAAGISVTREASIVEDWVASCFKGQVVFPAIFETFQIQKRGYFALCWFPGLLRYDDVIYARVRSSRKRGSWEAPISKQRKAVAEPCNLVPTMRTIWNVEASDGFLEAELALRDTVTGKIIPQSGRSPGTLFYTLTQSLMLESCPHDSSALLDPPDTFAVYTSPLKPFISPESDVVNVVAVDGVDGLRNFAMSYDICHCRAVVRRNSCLKCSLDFCRLLSAEILFL